MNRTVVLVESDSAVRSMVGELLRSEDYAVVEARDIGEAQSAVDAPCVDLVLADSAGPDRGEAMELFSEFGDRLGGRTRVVLCTAHPLSSEEARALGCADVLAKPFEIEELLHVVESSIAVSSA